MPFRNLQSVHDSIFGGEIAICGKARWRDRRARGGKEKGNAEREGRQGSMGVGIIMGVRVHCALCHCADAVPDTLQHTASHCNTLQQTASRALCHRADAVPVVRASRGEYTCAKQRTAYNSMPCTSFHSQHFLRGTLLSKTPRTLA